MFDQCGYPVRISLALSAFIGVTSAFIGVPSLLLLAATKEIKWT